MQRPSHTRARLQQAARSTQPGSNPVKAGHKQCWEGAGMPLVLIISALIRHAAEAWSQVSAPGFPEAWEHWGLGFGFGARAGLILIINNTGRDFTLAQTNPCHNWPRTGRTNGPLAFNTAALQMSNTSMSPVLLLMLGLEAGTWGQRLRRSCVVPGTPALVPPAHSHGGDFHQRAEPRAMTLPRTARELCTFCIGHHQLRSTHGDSKHRGVSYSPNPRHESKAK